LSIEWEDDLLVGNDVIDDDHKKLVSIINELERAIAKRDVSGVEDVFQRLQTYTEEHFAREEALQKAIHFPERNAHRDRHEALKWSLQDQYEGFRLRERGSLVSFRTFLRQWLIDHIVDDDMKMKPYLTGEMKP